MPFNLHNRDLLKLLDFTPSESSTTCSTCPAT